MPNNPAFKVFLCSKLLVFFAQMRDFGLEFQRLCP